MDKRMPENFYEYENIAIMSNFDREIEQDIVKAIKNKNLFSRYAGWNFNGKVWWENKNWHCEVWCYGSFIKTFSSKKLEQIMEEVSSEYGYD